MEYIKDDYADFTGSILSRQYAIEAIPGLIDNFINDKSDDINGPCLKLLRYIRLTQMPSTGLRKLSQTAKVVADFDGKMLHQNDTATAWEPLFILGNDKVNPVSIVRGLSKVLEGKNYDDKSDAYEQYRELTNRSSETDIIIRQRFPNLGDIDCVNCNYKIGDKISKGSIIASIEYFEFTPIALQFNERVETAKMHLKFKMTSSNIQVNTSAAQRSMRSKGIEKNLNTSISGSASLKDILKGGEPKFISLMSLLQKKKCDESGDFFVREDNGRFIWVSSPAKGWQMYLAAFIFTCRDKDLLWPNACSNINNLLKICKGTFPENELSPDSFNKLKVKKSIHDKYRKPFESMLF